MVHRAGRDLRQPRPGTGSCASGRTRTARAPTGSRRRPTAVSSTPRSPARTWPRSTPPRARSAGSTRRRRSKEHAACGPTARAASGSASGTAGSSAATRRPAALGRSWKLPGAEPHAYAVYVDGADMVWVSDFGANAVLRFDPATERFTATYPGSGPRCQRAPDLWPRGPGVPARIRGSTGWPSYVQALKGTREPSS